MSNDSEDSDRVTEEERLALAVEELRWSAAIASFEALAVEGIGAFRTRPGLEESILTMLAAGPVGAVRSVVARLLPTETDRFRSVAISRERAQLGIFRANLRWMDEQKAVGDYPGAAMHFSRASRVALVHESQGSSIRAEFSAMVELASSVEAVFEDSLADPHYLQRPHEADRIVADVLGDADPGNWMQIVSRPGSPRDRTRSRAAPPTRCG